MSTIAVSFDPHFWPHRRHGGPLVKGINRRAELCLNVGQRAIRTASQLSAPLIVAGDLIDSAGPVAPQFAFALREQLATNRRSVTLMLGNHDMTADGDHSLGIYTQCDDVQVCDDISYRSGDGFTYFVPASPDVCLVPFHRDIRDKRVRDVPLVIAHFGVYDDGFPAWCKKAKGAWHVDALFAFMQERNIKAICLGDWHQRHVWRHAFGTTKNLPVDWQGAAIPDGERLVMQGGALCPTGWDNPGLHGYGTVALWDADEHRLSWQELPGPRFCVARSEEEERGIIAEAQRLGHNLYLRRYYSGTRPETPLGLEAYEALPVAVERAAVVAAPSAAPNQLQQMVSDWLDQFNDDRDALAEHIGRYL
mgnify:CR=1 FL=1